MKTTEFRELPFRERVAMLREHGNYLATRTLENYYIRLYTVKGVYFEVWSSSHLPWENIVKVKVFDDFSTLKPYLPEVYFSENKMYL